MKNDRNLLLSSQILRFQVWLDENQIVWRKPKGDYQVLQIKMKNAWAAICTNAQGVISSPPCLREMISKFKKGQPFTGKAETTETSKIPYEVSEDLTVLRDDLAMAALPIVAEQFKRFIDDAAPEAGTFISPDGFPHVARAAYKLADAMIAARSEQP